LRRSCILTTPKCATKPSCDREWNGTRNGSAASECSMEKKAAILRQRRRRRRFRRRRRRRRSSSISLLTSRVRKNRLLRQPCHVGPWNGLVTVTETSASPLALLVGRKTRRTQRHNVQTRDVKLHLCRERSFLVVSSRAVVYRYHSPRTVICSVIVIFIHIYRYTQSEHMIRSARTELLS
jgi:hypothetical protein